MSAEPAPFTVPRINPPAATSVEPMPPVETVAADIIPRITLSELKTKFDSGANMLIVDTRPLEDYTEEHIPGSVSAPLSDIIDGKWVFPEDKNREIVFYCT